MPPSISEIETRWRASASRICVIVEGETEQEDAWFYNQWFGTRASDVIFFPQNGWPQVVQAVSELRSLFGTKSVFGIVDRDFREAPIYSPLPEDGILWTPKYTLENYLLDPECWHKVVRPFTRRTPKSGWNSAEEVTSTIYDLYQRCIPLSAHNATLNFLKTGHPNEFENLSSSQQEFKSHPKAIQNLGNQNAYFDALSADAGLNIKLSRRFESHLDRFQPMHLRDLEQVVSGKYVLKLLHEEYPSGSPTKQAWDDTLGAYIDACPEPPKDLRTLIETLIESATE